MALSYNRLPPKKHELLITGSLVEHSAAAHGHAKLVGARKETRELEKVNLQMRRLKLLEFVLSSSFPQTHRAVRWGYNRVGPPLAKLCRSNVWFADLTFLMLKPVEWMAVLLQGILGIPQALIARIYR